MSEGTHIGPDARVAVVGAGSWGTALAALLAGKGHPVRLWAHEPDVAREIRDEGMNRTYLGEQALPGGLDGTSRLDEALDGAEVVVSVSPSQFVDDVMGRAAAFLDPSALVVSASKGLEVGTLRTMDQVLEPHLSPQQFERLAVLSGPSFATEVAARVPTAVVVASKSDEARVTTQELFQTDAFRVYTNPDVVGVELGGSLKNVVAVATGVAAGLGFGHNTRAALITRGLAEITRLGLAKGAERRTFMGLAGMGDLVLTCTGELSRNRTVGYRLGRGETLEQVLGGMRAVAEGVRTAEAAFELGRRCGVEMPITEQVKAILTEAKDPRTAVHELMSREPKPEDWAESPGAE